MTAMDTRPATVTVAVPWGPRDSLPLEMPPSWSGVETVWPDVQGSLRDYAGALEHTLDAPLECRPIEQLVHAGSRVALVVDDPSRWTPVRDVLPVVLRRIHCAGVRLADVTINVGVGRHHAVDEAAMRRRVGDQVVDSYRCFSPPLDDLSQYVDLGRTPEGVPVRVFRPVAEANLRILIGSVLPHLQAGFGGGYKLIFPGTSHRSTLGALHRQGLGGHAGSLLGGEASRNPMRQAIRSATARLAGPCFSISHLLGAPGQVLHVVAGHPDAVQDELASEARGRFCAPPAPPADMIVVGNHPWPGDPMQSFKVLLNHRAAVRPGGVLAGLFWTDPGEIDRSLSLSVLRLIAATGAPGGWVLRHGLALADRVVSTLARPSAFLVRWARELVVDRTVLVYAPPLYEQIGPRLGPICLFSDQRQLWAAAAGALVKTPRPRVRVFPQGGLTYCPELDGGPAQPSDVPHAARGVLS